MKVSEVKKNFPSREKKNLKIYSRSRSVRKIFTNIAAPDKLCTIMFQLIDFLQCFS